MRSAGSRSSAGGASPSRREVLAEPSDGAIDVVTTVAAPVTSGPGPRAGSRRRLLRYEREHVVAGYGLAVAPGDVGVPANLAVGGGVSWGEPLRGEGDRQLVA